MRIVILGCGRVGAYLASSMAAEGHQVTVIDKEQKSFDRLGPKFTGDIVMGVGIDEDILRRAGIEKADAFVAVTNGDNTNVMAAQVAKEIFAVPRVICRIYDPYREEIYREMGLETICPTLWGASRIQEMLKS